jgi:peptidoglycan/LPS O-acetylase OafA/YrhL
LAVGLTSNSIVARLSASNEGGKMATDKKARLVGIDLLRVFAAVSVMFFHLAFHSSASTYPELAAWSSWGWVGVQIFFVISGFVIAYSAAKASWKTFAVGRFLRIAPALWICATVTLLALLTAAPLSELLPDYLRALTLWPTGPWIDPVYWTLTVEVSFYLVVFALLLVNRFAWLEPVMAAIAMLSIANYAAVRLLSRLDVIAAHPLPQVTQQLLLLQNGMHFGLGVFLWAGFTKGWTAFRLAMVGLCMAGGLLPILAISLGKHGEGSIPLVLVPLPLLIWLVAVAALIAVVFGDKHLSAGLSPTVIRVIKVFGLATYPLYLVHNVAGVMLLRLLSNAGVDRWAALSCSMAAMVGLAVAITLSLEPPVRRGLEGVFKRPSSAPPPL